MMVVRQGMILTVVGIAIGLAAAYVLTKYLESLTSMLFGVEARDPWTFAAIGILLTVVALIACLAAGEMGYEGGSAQGAPLRVKLNHG